MSKIKLTKSELKKQRDALKSFQRYLPTLQLKKQQLQMKINECQRELDKRFDALKAQEVQIRQWVGLLAETAQGEGAEKLNLSVWVDPVKVTTEKVNIAGISIPYLKEIIFNDVDYDFYSTPFWIDLGVKQLRDYKKLLVEVVIIQKQIELLMQELRVTTQRVNLFEKIKIPEAQDNIRRIRIYLGDQQAAAVGVSKVAKKKLEVAQLELVNA